MVSTASVLKVLLMVAQGTTVLANLIKQLLPHLQSLIDNLKDMKSSGFSVKVVPI